MDLLNTVAQAMQTVFTTQAEQAARQSGFCQRRSPLSATFVPAMTFACLAHPQPTLDHFCHTAAACGSKVTPQAFDGRFNEDTGPKSAEYLRLSLVNAVKQVIAEEPLATGLLGRFTAVAIQDSSTVVLPDCLEHLWQGNGGKTDNNTRSAVKLQVRLELLSGQLSGPFLGAGRSSDQNCVLQGDDDLPAAALRIADLGYFDLDEFTRLDGRNVFFLSRYQFGTALFTLQDEERLQLLRWLREQSAEVTDVPIKIGKKHRLKGRLVAIRVPEEVAAVRRKRLLENAKKKGKSVSSDRLALCAWTLLLTNIPVALASAAELVVLARCRWQIELLFKLWKSGAGLDKRRSDKPYRVLCEVYAKMIAVVVQHWVLVAGCWKDSRRSLTKAAAVVKQQALCLVAALWDRTQLIWVLRVTVESMAAGTRMHKSKKDPRTWQLVDKDWGQIPQQEGAADSTLHPCEIHCGASTS
jgi:Transposase DDE domain